MTKRLAEGTFCRDCRKDYKAAYDCVEGIMRELIWDDKTGEALDESAESVAAENFRETLWKFVKSEKGCRQ